MVLPRAVRQRLGAPEKVSAQDDILDAYHKLMSPHESYEVGRACGAGGNRPRGHVAMSSLVEAKRSDLLRNVLRGPNPEGRVFAGIGLEQLDLLSEADLKTVVVLMNTPVRINSCRGCQGWMESHAMLLIDLVFPKTAGPKATTPKGAPPNRRKGSNTGPALPTGE